MYADPTLSSFDVYGDLSGAEEFLGGSDDFRALAVEEAPFGGDRRLVLWAPSDVSYGVTRMFEALAEYVGAWRTVESFRSFEEAREALGLPDDWQPAFPDNEVGP